jgi:Pyruvate/2-oxoacid:ferredoxin oxidoreductase gamma subunit
MASVNDFAFKIGTVNGTGSASANSLLMQAIFRMGIPVSGKNIFPSNIQGLPTWYEIRVNKDGYTARPAALDLMVALNPETYAADVASLRPGGYLLYDSSWPLDDELAREDVTILGVPFGKMCVEAFQGDRQRTLLRNIAYVGAVAALLQIDLDVIATLLQETFGKKKHLRANHRAIRLGYDYATANSPLPFGWSAAIRPPIMCCSTEIPRQRLGASMRAQRSERGTPSRRRPRSWKASRPSAIAFASIPTATSASASCRRRTSSQRPGWSSEHPGLAPAHSPRRQDPASR